MQEQKDFVQKMYNTDYIFNGLELQMFVKEHFQSGLTFEGNAKNFFEWVDNE